MTVKLAVAGAFHTEFMQPAVEQLQGALAATAISTPRIPVISNVDAQPHSDPDTIRDILARQVWFCSGAWSFRASRVLGTWSRMGSDPAGRFGSDPAAGWGMAKRQSPMPAVMSAQVTNPVQWETTLKTLLEKGLTQSYEIGPNKVIAGIMKRIDKSSPITNITA